MDQEFKNRNFPLEVLFIMSNSLWFVETENINFSPPMSSTALKAMEQVWSEKVDAQLVQPGRSQVSTPSTFDQIKYCCG